MEVTDQASESQVLTISGNEYALASGIYPTATGEPIKIIVLNIHYKKMFRSLVQSVGFIQKLKW